MLLYRAVQDVRVVYHIQDRHGRREQARSQFAPLTATCPRTHAIFPNLPPEPRSDTTILTPCPMLRCLSAKSIALVLIALNALEETARGQGGGARRFADGTESFAYPPEAGGVARAMACCARACEGPRGRERARS